jgi:hypothetical protein
MIAGPDQTYFDYIEGSFSAARETQVIKLQLKDPLLFGQSIKPIKLHEPLTL